MTGTNLVSPGSLLSAATSGPMELEQLLKSFPPSARRRLQRARLQPADQDDLLQNVYLTLLRFPARQNLRALAYRVLRCVLAAHLRGRKSVTLASPEAVVDHRPSEVSRFEEAEEAKIVLGALLRAVPAKVADAIAVLLDSGLDREKAALSLFRKEGKLGRWNAADRKRLLRRLRVYFTRFRKAAHRLPDVTVA